MRLPIRYTEKSKRTFGGRDGCLRDMGSSAATVRIVVGAPAGPNDGTTGREHSPYQSITDSQLRREPGEHFFELAQQKPRPQPF